MMSRYVRKLFSVMFQVPQTQQIAHIQTQPMPNSTEEWRQYWQERGFPWRTEPEIDTKRQEELDKHRAIVPDIKKKIYPFKGMKLCRADVEWLLATHENGQGPVLWNKEKDKLQGARRTGLDLRGANLSGVNLQLLPLACLIGGMSLKERWSARSLRTDEGLIHLEGANLCNVHLEGARLSCGHLERIDLYCAYLEDADFSSSHLESAWLDKAHLENANLHAANLIAAHLEGAYLKNANFSGAEVEGANLDEAHLENADLSEIHLEKASLKKTFLNNANLSKANLAGANLHNAHLEGADLLEAHLEGKRMPADDLGQVRKWYHGPRWRGMDDSINSQEEWEDLQEEFPEELSPANLRICKKITFHMIILP